VTISIASSLLDVLGPSFSSVGPACVQKVFDTLARQQSTTDSGAVGRVTTSSSFPFSGGAVAANTLGTGDNDDADDDVAKLIANISSSSPYLPGYLSPLSHVSSVVSQTSSTSNRTNTATPGNKTTSTVATRISSSRDKLFRKNSSNTCDDFEEDTKRTQLQNDRDNEHGQDFERAENLLDVVGGVMVGKNLDMEVSLHLGGDQAGANLDRTQSQDAVMKVCVCKLSCYCWSAHHEYK